MVIETDITGREYTIGFSDYDTDWMEYTHDQNIPFELGQTWIVKEYYGYENPVQQHENGELYIGNWENGGIPYCITSNTVKLNKIFLSNHRLGTSGSLTLTCQSGSIYETSLKKMEAKYLPDSLVKDIEELQNNQYTFVVNFTMDGDNNCKADQSFATVLEACRNNKRVIGFADDPESIIFNVFYYGDTSIAFIASVTNPEFCEHIFIFCLNDDETVDINVTTIPSIKAFNEIYSKIESLEEIATDEHITDLINTQLGVIENDTY